jgi:hypothetical protein
MSSEKPSKLQDVIFVATHSVLSIRAVIRRVTVATEFESPPHTSTWEEFPKLPLAEATRRMKKANERLEEGVPRSAWSKTDQERMTRGELPLGHPEHPNV